MSIDTHTSVFEWAKMPLPEFIRWIEAKNSAYEKIRNSKGK